MRHLAVYMMLVLGGTATPSKEDVTKALSTVGIEADEARLDHLLSELEGKDLKEIIAEGTKKLASFGGGGGGGGGGGAAAGGGGSDAGAAAAAPKVEEKEEEEEVDMGGGMDMFGGGEGGGDY